MVTVKPKLMRSRAVGIDKQQNGFVKLGQLSCLFELFQTVYRLRTAPSHAGGCLGRVGLPWAACGTQPSWAHTTHAFTTAFYWKMAQTLGAFANMLRFC